MKEDIEIAALRIYPVDWFESETIHGKFKIDNNASKRAVAKEVLLNVFEILNSEHLAGSMTSAFCRRVDYKILKENDKRQIDAYMGTALLLARISIRDGINE